MPQLAVVPVLVELPGICLSGLVNEFGARAIEMKESFEVATLFAGIDRVDPPTRDDISTVLAHGLWVPLAWNLGPGQ